MFSKYSVVYIDLPSACNYCLCSEVSCAYLPCAPRVSYSQATFALYMLFHRQRSSPGHQK